MLLVDVLARVTLRRDLRHLDLRIAVLCHQRGLDARLLHRIETGALHVLDDGEFERLLGGRLHHRDRHLVQAGALGAAGHLDAAREQMAAELERAKQAAEAEERGKALVFDATGISDSTGEEELVLLPQDGKGKPVLLTEGPSSWHFPPVWSPDSKFLRAIVPSSDPFAESATLSTWIIPADEASPREIATFSGFPIEVYLSPNQQYIAFWKAEPPQSNRRELHLARFDGSREVIYQAGYQLEVRGWAPDSVHFVFREGPSGQPQLGNICGEYKPLTDAPTTSGIDWVDSTRFIFIGDNQQGRELRLGAIGEPSILIGAFNGKDATYQVNREDAAIGLPY